MTIQKTTTSAFVRSEVNRNMTPIPLLPKNHRHSFTPAEINAAIVKFKAMFPDNAQLAGTPNTKMASSVASFLASNQVTVAGSAAAASTTITPCAKAIAVVVIDVVFVFFSFAGLDIPDEGAVTSEIVDGVAEAVDESLPAWQQLISDLQNATSITEQAKAIWAILSKAYTIGMFGTIASAIENAVPWYDWVIAGVAALAQIAVLILTDGAAFIAELILASTSVAWLVDAAVKASTVCNA